MKPPKRIYIAAPWSERQRAARWAKDKLTEAGFVVTSSWIDRDVPQQGPWSVLQLRQEAQRDINDILSSDIFLLLNSQARGEETSGKAVETGIAIMADLPIILVGEWSNIFHHLSSIESASSVEGAIRRIQDGIYD